MKEFFDKQGKLDDIVLANFEKRIGQEITHKQLFEKRLLAAYREIGEFNKEKDLTKKVEEFADITHFVLSCGLSLNISECVSKHSINTLYEQSISNNYHTAINNLYDALGEFSEATQCFKYWKIHKEHKNIEKYYFKCFLRLFDLAKTMHYSIGDIKNAYHYKWEKNIKRQKSEY